MNTEQIEALKDEFAKVELHLGGEFAHLVNDASGGFETALKEDQDLGPSKFLRVMTECHGHDHTAEIKKLCDRWEAVRDQLHELGVDPYEDEIVIDPDQAFRQSRFH